MTADASASSHGEPGCREWTQRTETTTLPAGTACRAQLPHNRAKKMTARLKLDDTFREWKRVRLEFDRDFQRDGVRPDELRGELFLYNRGTAPLSILLDGARFEP